MVPSRRTTVGLSRLRRELNRETKNTEKDGNTAIAPLGATPGSPLSTFRLDSARLSSRNRIYPGLSLVDSSDAASRCCRRRCSLPPLWLLAATAATAVSLHRCRLELWPRLQPPLLPPSTATSVTAAVVVGRSRRRRRRRRRHSLPPLSLCAAAAAAVDCDRRRCRLCRWPLPPSPLDAAASAAGRTFGWGGHFHRV